jgi:uncharacterized phiE125 gp8 family phage protein
MVYPYDARFPYLWPNQTDEPEFVFDPTYAADGAAVLSTTELKTICRIELTDDDDQDAAVIARDAMLGSYEAAARNYCEALSGYTFSSRTFRLLCPRPSEDGRIYLRKTPVTSITSVKFYGTDGNQRTLTANTDYQPWLVGQDPFIAPASGTSFYDNLKIDPPRQDAIEIIFVAGFASNRLPQRFLDAVRTYVAWRNDNPGDVVTVPEAVNSFCRTARIRRRGPNG